MTTPSHKQAQRWLELAADVGLSASERAALDAHLRGCAMCYAYSAELQSLETGLRRALRTRLNIYPSRSTMLARKLHSHLRRATFMKRFFRTSSAVIGLAGAIASLAVLVILFRELSRDRTPLVPVTATPTLTPLTFHKIDREPAPLNFRRGAATEVSTYDPNSDQPWQVDLRSYDLSFLDLSDALDDLMHATFDSQTTWPPAERMPSDFDWQRIMGLGKNPGLGVHSLHEQGFTGRGVGLAIIDQTLLVNHQEYADQLRLYEEAENITEGWLVTQMHGPAVASIAVGKTVGVAPEADLYYIATNVVGADNKRDFTYVARSIHRILEVNQQLPAGRKIRVISISVGWSPEETGYTEVTEAVEEANAAGIFVVSSNLEETYNFKFHGLGRAPLADPDAFESYVPGSFWAKSYSPDAAWLQERLLIPMDSRTTASPTGPNDYVFYREGGWSWSIPYIAGVYALVAQVDPAITPDRFWALALETSRTTKIEYSRQTVSFGPILDPAALIKALQQGH